jgi:hypothetical protein
MQDQETSKPSGDELRPDERIFTGPKDPFGNLKINSSAAEAVLIVRQLRHG